MGGGGGGPVFGFKEFKVSLLGSHKIRHYRHPQGEKALNTVLRGSGLRGVGPRAHVDLKTLNQVSRFGARLVARLLKPKHETLKGL